jgi:hypothetical protein
MKNKTTTTRSRKGVTVNSIAVHALDEAIAQLMAARQLLSMANPATKKGASK